MQQKKISHTTFVFRSGPTSRKRVSESPCSEFSTRSQSEIQQHPTIMTSTSAVGAHGYNNEQFQSRQQQHHNKSKPLKQLVVTAGKVNLNGKLSNTAPFFELYVVCTTGSSRKKKFAFLQEVRKCDLGNGAGGLGSMGHHRFHHHHSHHPPAASSSQDHRQAPSNTHVLHQHTDHNTPSAIRKLHTRLRNPKIPALK